MPPRVINQGWSPPGTHSDTTKHRYDLKRGWIKPGHLVGDHGLQFVGEGQGWDPSKQDAAWHTVISPRGVAAPLGAINYTPATGEVHAAGMQAPVNEDNVSLMPLDSFSFGNDMVGTGQGEEDQPETPSWDQQVQGNADQGPWDTGIPAQNGGTLFADGDGNLYVRDAVGMSPIGSTYHYNWGTGQVTDPQGQPVAASGRVEPSLAPQTQASVGGQPIPPAVGSPPGPTGNTIPPATGNPPTSASGGTPLQQPAAAGGTDIFGGAAGGPTHHDYTGGDGVRHTWNGSSYDPPDTYGGRPPSAAPTRIINGQVVQADAQDQYTNVLGPSAGPRPLAPVQHVTLPDHTIGSFDPNTNTTYDSRGQIIGQGPRPGGSQPGAVGGGMGPIQAFAQTTAQQYRLDPDIFLRLLAQENGFKTDLTPNSAGAKGVAQFMPGTAHEAAQKLGVTDEQFWADPKLQITGAALLLSEYKRQFGGSDEFALIAYNAGPSKAQALWDAGQMGPGLRNSSMLDPQTQLYLHTIMGGHEAKTPIEGLQAGSPGVSGGVGAFPVARRTQVVTGLDGVDRLVDLTTGEVIKEFPGGGQDPRTKPMVAGNRVIQYNPETKTYDTVYQGPTQHQIAQSGGHLFSIDPETQQTTSLYDTPGKPELIGGDVFLPPDVGYKRAGWTGPSGLNQPEQNFTPTAKTGWDLPSWVKRGPGGASGPTSGSQGPVPPPWAAQGASQPQAQSLGGNGLDPNDPFNQPYQDLPPSPDLGMGQDAGPKTWKAGGGRWVGVGEDQAVPPKLKWDKMAVSVGVGGSEQPIPPIDPSQIVGGGNKFGQQVSMEGTHQGTDLQAYEGTPVIAPIAGVVVGVDSDPQGLGLQVHIRAQDGRVYTVAHLSRTLVQEGQRVEQGQPIAHVGESGAGATGPHLDYRIQSPDGQYVNPEPQLGQLGNLPEAPNTIQEGQQKPPVGGGQSSVYPGGLDPARTDLMMRDSAAIGWNPQARGRQVQDQPLTPVDDLGGSQDQGQQQDPSQADWLGQTPQQPQIQMPQEQSRQWQAPQGGSDGMASGGVSGGGFSGSAPSAGGDVAQAALSDPDKWAMCGPVAVVIAAGNGWTVDQAKQYAQSQGLWDPQNGMHGLQSEIGLLKGMGIDADIGPAHPELISRALQAGVYPIISTPLHYFTIKGYDQASGAYNVSTTGTALRGGSEWMTLDQIDQMGGGIQGAAYIRQPNATGGGQASVGTGQGQWVGKGDAWGSDPSFSPFNNDLTGLYNQQAQQQQAQAQSAPQWQDTGPTIYQTETLQHQQEQIDNQRQQIDNQAQAEQARHQEAMASAKTAAAQQKEQARHDKAMEQLQQQAQVLQKQEDQYKAYNDAQNRNAQYNIQGTFGQQQQSKLLQSALTNPWLQSLTGMAPGYGTPGWSGTQGGGVLQSLLNGWNPGQTPDFSMHEQTPKPPSWVKFQQQSGGNQSGGGSQGTVQAQGAGATSGGTSPMDAILGSQAGGGASQAGYGGYAPLASAPPTPAYGQWQRMTPFERSAWRTLAQSAEPFPAAVQGARQDWAQGGVFDAPNSAKLSATQMSPLDMMGQNQTAEMFGQSPQNYWQGQQKTWSKSAAPSITTVDQ